MVGFGYAPVEQPSAAFHLTDIYHGEGKCHKHYSGAVALARSIV